MKALLMSLMSAVVVTACANTPTPISKAVPAPSDRVMAYQGPVAQPAGTIVVTRDSGHAAGAACLFAVWINGTLAARLDIGETSRFSVPAGDVLFRVQRDPMGKGLCAVGDSDWTQRETTLHPGEIKYFRLVVDSARPDIQRADSVD